jgi:adenosylcobinamide-GDP ribazoletransferase
LVFKPFVAVLSFLTIIPSARHSPSSPIDIKYIATNMYLFPLVGALIGLSAGLVGYGLSLVLEPQITSLLVVLFITLITGLHHTDALADFGDGLMVKRGRESKKNAMHDHSIGSAGATALILYFIGIFTTLSSIRDGTALLSFLLTSEVIAKYVMVEQAHFGKAAWDGLSSPFILAMKSKMKFISSTMITLTIVFLVTGYEGLLTFVVAFLIAGLIQGIAHLSFGGISGDVMGASNEIVRLSCLIFISSVSGFISS